jgi:hypothetical protein
MIADSVAAAVAALRAEGLVVAVRSGDLTPPCVYVQIGTAADAEGILADGTITGLWCYWIPVRGVENLDGDAAALDSMFAALRPLGAAAITATRTSLTVSNDTWPGYRVDVSVIAVPDQVGGP